MSDPNQPSTPPGWYPDGQGGQRWWDGNQWTEHTQPPAGGSAPSAPAAPAAPSGPAAPAGPGGDLPTQLAPNRAASYPDGAPAAQPAASQPQQPVYGAPAGATGPAGYGQQPFGGTGGSGTSGGGRGKLFAILGGALAALLLLAVGLFVLFTFVLGGGPDDVAEDYLRSEFDFDAEKKCELLSEKAQEEELELAEVDDCEEYAEESEKNLDESREQFEEDYDESLDDVVDDIDYSVEIEKVDEQGDDVAIVDYKETYEYTGGDDDILEEVFDGEEKDTEEGQIKLVKEDGDWKVDDPYYSEDDSDEGDGEE